MKTLLTLALLSVAFGAVAQRSFSKHVTTDGRQLRIRVDIEQPGRSVHYSRSFDVVGREASAVKALENHIIDSLDQVVGETTYSSDYTTSTTTTPTVSPSDVTPLSVRVREDKENGRLWMQYTFQKDGDELIIERTANVLGKTEREKQAIIKETERSFGIKTGNQ